jgi:hypothetical protein
VLEKIQLLSSLLPIVFFVFFCKRKATKELWVIFVYFITSLAFDLFLALSLWASDHRFLIWNFFGILENILLSYFFYLIINQRLIRSLILLFSFLYLIFVLFYFKSDNDQFNSTMSAVGSVIILVLSLCYFLNTLKPSVEPTNFFTPQFLIVIALLLNVSCTLFLDLITSRLTFNELAKYWIINSYANILMNLIISSAFILFYNQHKSKPPENHSVDFTSPNDR